MYRAYNANIHMTRAIVHSVSVDDVRQSLVALANYCLILHRLKLPTVMMILSDFLRLVLWSLYLKII